MLKLSLSTPLFNLLPEAERARVHARRRVILEAEDWEGARREMRMRFPDLAAQVLTEGDQLATGFALVVNDEVLRHNDEPPRLSEGDEIALIAAIAGG